MASSWRGSRSTGAVGFWGISTAPRRRRLPTTQLPVLDLCPRLAGARPRAHPTPTFSLPKRPQSCLEREHEPDGEGSPRQAEGDEQVRPEDRELLAQELAEMLIRKPARDKKRWTREEKKAAA